MKKKGGKPGAHWAAGAGCDRIRHDSLSFGETTLHSEQKMDEEQAATHMHLK